MHRFAQFVAVVACLGILVVLITPVHDELPCMATHGAFMLVLPLSGISAVVQLASPAPRPNLAEVPLFAGTERLYFTCTLLC
jgi:hypothetical protein